MGGYGRENNVVRSRTCASSPYVETPAPSQQEMWIFKSPPWGLGEGVTGGGRSLKFSAFLKAQHKFLESEWDVPTPARASENAFCGSICHSARHLRFRALSPGRRLQSSAARAAAAPRAQGSRPGPPSGRQVQKIVIHSDVCSGFATCKTHDAIHY